MRTCVWARMTGVNVWVFCGKSVVSSIERSDSIRTRWMAECLRSIAGTVCADGRMLLPLLWYNLTQHMEKTAVKKLSHHSMLHSDRFFSVFGLLGYFGYATYEPNLSCEPNTQTPRCRWTFDSTDSFSSTCALRMPSQIRIPLCVSVCILHRLNSQHPWRPRNNNNKNA